MKKLEGMFNGKDLRVGIVAGRFNEFITSKLLEGAVDGLIRHETNLENIETAWVPGAFEIPLIAKKMANSKKYDVVITLGAVIKGSTPHFDYVSAEVSKGVAHVALDSEIPVIFGVLTTNSIEEAIERAGTKAGNKGFEAAMSAIEMVNLIKQIENKYFIKYFDDKYKQLDLVKVLKGNIWIKNIWNWLWRLLKKV